MKDKQEEFTIVIDAQSSNKEYIKDIFRYRDLFYFLAWRDIIVRYKQAFFGVAWALFRPVMNMVVFAFLFGKIAKLPSDHIYYPFFVLAGLIPWQLFSNAIVDCSNSMISNSHLISKIYFPRMIIPTSAIMIHLVDFFISAAMLLILTMIGGSVHYETLPFLPIFVLLTFLLCLGVGFWLSALTVRYRDFRILVPFATQFGMFISPVGYGSFMISDSWKYLYFMNPMAGIIDGFRWSLFGISHPYLIASVSISIGINLLLLMTGYYYFRNMERFVADII